MRYTTLLNLLTVAKAGGCDQYPCLNNGQCYDIGENEYECICDSFAGKNCQIRKLLILTREWGIFIKNVKKYKPKAIIGPMSSIMTFSRGNYQ